MCPVCGSNSRRLASDIRPVFPEERLLFEFLSDREPNSLIESSIWANGSRYYIDGKSESVSLDTIRSADCETLRNRLNEYGPDNTYDYFNKHVKRFIQANSNHLREITWEAVEFINKSREDFSGENIAISFSGGKDSTVTADLVMRALSDPRTIHVFGNTTLEFPTTIEYSERYRKSHPLAIIKTATNNFQNFYSVAEEIGPPARMMRWCCSMFKTGPITRAFSALFGNEQVLTYQGIRKCESPARSKYRRFDGDAESVKIQNQVPALPIFNWKNLDVWLYILSEEIDFNNAYRLGYERAGCWCCPNNNERAEMLANIYMPEAAEAWHSFLMSFAIKIGKPDPDVYVDEGWWKARQGGNGLAAAKSVKVDAEFCTTEENAAIFPLTKPFSEELVNLFCPLGKYSPGLGSPLLDEHVFVDYRAKTPLFSIMPFSKAGYDHALKIKVNSADDVDSILRMAKYQVRKYNACRQCLKCESLCKFGAIRIMGATYFIDEDKCTHCKQCVTDKYIDGGCLMGKYLRTLKD